MTEPVGNPWLVMALNNAWANATLYRALCQLSDEAFQAEAPGFFPTLARTMNHIHDADLYFLDALERGGKGRTVFQREDIISPRPLAEVQAELDMRFAQFCRSLTETDLAETREMERPDGVYQETVGAMILQLVQHQIHHRGQAHVQLTHAGFSPPQLDEFHLRCNRAPSAKAYWSS